MFDIESTTIEIDRVQKFRIKSNGDFLTYANVIDLWRTDPAFRSVFTQLLIDSSFSGFRWETPPITSDSASREFEFVLLNTPGFASRQPDRKTYRGYFESGGNSHGIVAFQNLSGDATLVVPSPLSRYDDYGHLAAFVRNATGEQTDAFWQVVGESVAAKLSNDPLWVNTAGGGVAWLHVRLDSRPKYYGHTPYKNAG